jgi:hypothetical protein
VHLAGSFLLSLQVQTWKYGNKTRVIRAAARSARDAGVRTRELAPGELTDEMKHKLLHDITGASRLTIILSLLTASAAYYTL